jgi:serine/threonine-protein kinase RsbW
MQFRDETAFELGAQIPSVLKYERVIRYMTQAIAVEARFDETQVRDIQLAVSEACTNAIEHGNGNNPDLPVRVIWLIAPQRYLEIQIIDSGQRALIPNVETEKQYGGWGLFLISELMDELETSNLPDGANQVRLRVRLPIQK